MNLANARKAAHVAVSCALIATAMAIGSTGPAFAGDTVRPAPVKITDKNTTLTPAQLKSLTGQKSAARSEPYSPNEATNKVTGIDISYLLSSIPTGTFVVGTQGLTAASFKVLKKDSLVVPPGSKILSSTFSKTNQTGLVRVSGTVTASGVTVRVVATERIQRRNAVVAIVIATPGRATTKAMKKAADKASALIAANYRITA